MKLKHENNAFSQSTLAKKLTWSASLLCGFFLTLQSIISYQSLYNVVRDTARRQYEQELINIRNSVEYCIQEMQNYTYQLSRNERLISLLKQWCSTSDYSYDYIEMQKNIRNLLNVLITGRNEVSNIVVLMDDKYISSNLDLEYSAQAKRNIDKLVNQVKLSQGSLSQNGVLMYVFQHKERDIDKDIGIDGNKDINNDKDNKNEGTILFLSGIDIKDIGDLIIIVVMDNEWISGLVSNNSNISIYDSINNRYLYGTKSDDVTFKDISSGYLKDEAIKNNKYSITVASDEENRRIYTLYSNFSDITEFMRKILLFGLTAYLFCLMLAYIVSKMFVGKVMEPVRLLANSFEDNINSLKENGNFSEDNAEKNKQVQIVYQRHRKKFSDVLMTFFLITCIIPIIICFCGYYILMSVLLEDSVENLAIEYVKQSSKNVQTVLKNVEQTALTLSIDRNIQEIMMNSSDYIISTPNLTQIKELLQTANNFEKINGYKTNISLYDTEGNLILSTQGMDNDIEPTILEYYMETNYPYDIVTIEEGTLKVFRRVRSVYDNSRYKILGYLQISIYSVEFRSMLSIASAENVQTYIFDSNYIPFLYYESSDDLKELNDLIINSGSSPSLFKKEGKYYTSIRIIPQDWIILNVFEPVTFNSSHSNLIMKSVIIMLGMVCIILLIAYRLSSRFSSSIEILQYNLLSWNDKGPMQDFSVGIEDSEIARIANTFNLMSERIQQLIKDTYNAKLSEMQLENNLKQAELLALQAQINPHFLYNTLELMKYMVYENETETVINMIDMLGDLFRAAVRNKTLLVPLQEEIDYARAYATLQCIRFDGMLDVQFEMNDEVSGIMVPKLIIQPIIENAIVHRKRNDKPKLYISVKAYTSDKQLIIEVRNNGNSIEPVKLAQLQDQLNNNENSEGIGLINVNRRLRLHFGTEYGAKIENCSEGGILVTLNIPIRN